MIVTPVFSPLADPRRKERNPLMQCIKYVCTKVLVGNVLYGLVVDTFELPVEYFAIGFVGSYLKFILYGSVFLYHTVE